jgi:hypothetical protein
MSTKMVQFHIELSATSTISQPFGKKCFLVDMDVDSESGEVLAHVVSLCPADTGSNDNEEGDGVEPQGIGMPPQDPPTIEIDVAA